MKKEEKNNAMVSFVINDVPFGPISEQDFAKVGGSIKDMTSITITETMSVKRAKLLGYIPSN
jgi:hypothetical protein